MIRGTTPTFILKLKNKDGTPSTINLAEANNVYFTIAQGGKTITKTSEDIDIDGNTVYVFLNQKESLSLKEAIKTEVQLNWTYNDPTGVIKRAATRVREVALDKQLYREEIQ